MGLDRLQVLFEDYPQLQEASQEVSWDDAVAADPEVPDEFPQDDVRLQVLARTRVTRLRYHRAQALHERALREGLSIFSYGDREPTLVETYISSELVVGSEVRKSRTSGPVENVNPQQLRAYCESLPNVYLCVCRDLE